MSRYELRYITPVAPDEAEILGNWLWHTAEERAADLADDASDGQRRIVADLFHIAADAIDSAAVVSVGQPRREHYINRADWLRRRAEEITSDDN
jgi:hypothetical protein